MQAVCFVMGWVFASGIGSWRCGSFCRRVGFTQGQLYAVVFVVRVFASGICSWRCGSFCRRVGFTQGQFSAAVFVVLGGFRKCKPFVLSWGGFLQAVLVPGGAVRFVVVWVLPRGSCTRLCFWFGAVCVSASRLFCRGVFFCTRYWFLAVRFVL